MAPVEGFKHCVRQVICQAMELYPPATEAATHEDADGLRAALFTIQQHRAQYQYFIEQYVNNG